VLLDGVYRLPDFMLAVHFLIFNAVIFLIV